MRINIPTTLITCTLALVQISLFSALNVGAQLINTTIDDSYTGGITGVALTYSPPGQWSPGATCTSQSITDFSLALPH